MNNKPRNKRAAIVALACAVVLVVALAGAAAVKTGILPFGSGAAGEKTVASTADVDFSSGHWIIDMFRDLSPVVGGNAESWKEADGRDDWDFKVEQPAGENATYFSYTDSYKKMAASAGMDCTVAALTDALNEKLGQGETPFVVADGVSGYALTDNEGHAVGYEVNDALRNLAKLASAYKTSMEEASKNLNGTTIPDDVTYEDGAPIRKGRIDVSFFPGTSNERIKEIAAKLGFEVGKIHEYEYVEDDEENLNGIKHCEMCVPENGEKKAIKTLEKYPEVKHAEQSEYISVLDNTEVSEGAGNSK